MRSALVALLALGLAGCVEKGPTIFIGGPTQTNSQGNAGGTGTAGDGSSGSLPSGSYVRVGVFGYTGCSFANSSGLLSVGCTAHVTCTPKAPDGSDLPLEVHGPSATWTVLGNGTTVQASNTDNPFNLNVRGLAAGLARLTCVVKGVSGSLDLTVQ